MPDRRRCPLRAWPLLVALTAPAACAASSAGGTGTGPVPATRSSSASTEDVHPPGAVFAPTLDAYISSLGERWGEDSAFSGYVAIARDGQLVFGKSYGKVDRDGRIAADPDTLFEIGSVSKSFTAIGILQLEEKGLLRIEHPVAKYLPELSPLIDGVTIRHCLAHTAGLPPFPGDAALAEETGRMHPVGAAFAKYRTAKRRFPPGERFEYSNAGYVLLGAILERVAGQSYEAYMHEHVFAPAGMLRTTTVTTPAPSHMAVGFSVGERDDVSVALPSPAFVALGCGGVLSTVNDLLAWDRALSGTRLLDDASKRRMFEPDRDVALTDFLPAWYALGWFVSKQTEPTVFFHPGGTNGFESLFARVPAKRLTLVVLSNRSGVPDVMTKVELATEQLALTGQSPPPEPTVTSVDASGLAELAGEYRIDEPTRAVLIARFSREVADRFEGLGLKAVGERLFSSWPEKRGPEIVRSSDGALLMKREGLRIDPERDPSGVARAITLVPLHPDRPPMRYVRIVDGIVVKPAPGGGPTDMVRVPGGMLAAGSDRTVAPFCMDRTEVTVAAYTACARSGACRRAPTTAHWERISDDELSRWGPACNGDRSDRQDHPANCVDWSQATAYCRARGKRLPTSDEWQWAAQGGAQARRYPWGYSSPLDSDVCWSGSKERTGTCPIGSSPGSDALGGIHDLAGNVWEWTSTATAEKKRVVAGGAWIVTQPENVTVASRLDTDPTFRGPNVGFRCVK